MALASATIIFSPLYFIIIGGMMDDKEINQRPPYLIPPNPTTQHYVEVAKLLKINFANTAIIAISVTMLTLALAIPCAFGLIMLKARLSTALSGLFALLQVLPTVATVIPLFLIFYKLRLLNNYLSVVLSISAFSIPFATLVLTAYMKSIPTSLIEAAQVDGASFLRILWSVVLPLAKPGIATAGMLVFMQGWSNFVFPAAFLQKGGLQPVSVSLFTFISQYGVRWNRLMAASALYALPPVLAVIIAGKRIVEGLLAGAMKE
ncbi:MAG: carbohydrate ABC transporter permease [Nitrososphaerota archaeon]